VSSEPSGRGQDRPDGAAPAGARDGRRTILSVQPVAERGGSDQALLRMVRQLSADGWAVHVALPAPSPMAGEFESAGAALHVVPMHRISTSHDTRAWVDYALGWPGSVLELWRLSRQVGADVLHSNSLHSWYGWAAGWLSRTPHVWHAREIVVQSRSALTVERFLALRFARVVLAVSGAVAAQLSPRNVVVVHEEADTAEFYPGRAGRARAGAGLPDSALVIGYVGRIDTWKGVDVLLDCIPLLRQLRLGEDIRLVVAGGPVGGKEKEDYARSLSRRADALGAQWLGPLPGPAAADLIADLDCLALPSTEPEPWGLVVATDAGGPREILDGLAPGAGVLVPPRDATALASAIAKLLPGSTSPELRRQRAVLRKGAPPPYSEILGRLADEKEEKRAEARNSNTNRRYRAHSGRG
jgi:glycosyltransferase involved in cell wall biosynthesis